MRHSLTTNDDPRHTMLALLYTQGTYIYQKRLVCFQNEHINAVSQTSFFANVGSILKY